MEANNTPFELFGIECDEGWRPLVNKAIDIIKKYNDEHKLDEDFIPVEFTQIKEKWGELCLYLNYYVPEIADQIHTLENKSLEICEHCGTNKNVSTEWTHGWVMTLCEDCRKKEIERFNKEFHYEDLVK